MKGCVVGLSTHQTFTRDTFLGSAGPPATLSAHPAFQRPNLRTVLENIADHAPIRAMSGGLGPEGEQGRLCHLEGTN